MTRKEKYDKAGEILGVMALWGISFEDAYDISQKMRESLAAKGRHWYADINTPLVRSPEDEESTERVRARIFHEPKETEQ